MFCKVLLCTYYKDLFCLQKSSHHPQIPRCRHKALSTIGNEKEQKQIKCYVKLTFSRVTKILKIIYVTRATGRVLQKQGHTTVCYSDRLHDFSITIPRCYKDIYVNGFFPCIAGPCNFLHIECFPLTYDLSGFKSRINRHLLTLGSF